MLNTVRVFLESFSSACDNVFRFFFVFVGRLSSVYGAVRFYMNPGTGSEESIEGKRWDTEWDIEDDRLLLRREHFVHSSKLPKSAKRLPTSRTQLDR